MTNTYWSLLLLLTVVPRLTGADQSENVCAASTVGNAHMMMDDTKRQNVFLLIIARSLLRFFDRIEAWIARRAITTDPRSFTNIWRSFPMD